MVVKNNAVIHKDAHAPIVLTCSTVLTQSIDETWHFMQNQYLFTSAVKQ